ncbi:hypothetical protein FNYG_03656 [Fusarium nygamai]|uniref:SNF2 N-terminal domain-containing protein n=1 Tax=Gibberella nygamai TaxID=42673 RepID=A0A2K0WM42_GIBNY|nr:hypothetical protein FNYG_03656 [Fusarium nygamai]
MAYNNTSNCSVHALFEASFQKLTDVVSSDTSTVSHKAHCGRAPSDALIQRHILVGGRHEDLYQFLSTSQYEEHLNHLGNTDFHSHLDIFDELNTKLKHWQKAGGGKLVWLAKSPFKVGFLADAMGLGKSLQAWVAALEEHCLWWIILDDAKIDTALLLDYDIVIFSRDFLKSRYRDSVTFE